MEGNGMINRGRENKYLYNGKELNEEFGLNWASYGAREYDASIGRWMSTDPMSGLYLSFSPYAYTTNNPIVNYDPNGMYSESMLQSDIEWGFAITVYDSRTQQDHTRSDKLGKGNVVVNIQDGAFSGVLDPQDMKKGNSTWDYISVENLFESIEWLENYLVKHNLDYFNNIVIYAHGNEEVINVGPKGRIFDHDLESYSQGGNVSSGVKKNIDALIDIANMMSNGNSQGNLSFVNCQIGKDRIPQYLKTLIFDVRGISDFNMFLNTNYSRGAVGSEKFFRTFKWGEPLSAESRTDLSPAKKPLWKLIKKSGITDIKSDLIINKNKGQPISIMKNNKR